MKKSAVILISLLAISTFAVITSCITNGNDDDPTAPTVMSDTDTITVSFNSIDGMAYANVFRESASDKDFKNKDITPVNIGQVVPESGMPNSFQFVDSYTSDNYYYRYFIRYYKDGYYTYTQKTKEVRGKRSDTDAEAELTFDGDTLTMIYEENTIEKSYYLILDNNTYMTKDFAETSETDVYADLYIVISNGTDTKPYRFKMSEADSNSDRYVVKKDTKTSDLRLFLLSSFLGKNITVKSIIGVKKGSSLAEDYTNYYWTKPSTVTVNWTTIDDPLNPGGTTVSGEKHIKVPVVDDQTNNFDYNPSSRAAWAAEEPVLDFSPYQP